MVKSTAVAALLVLGLVAVSVAREKETVQELVARAEAARPDKQPDLYMEAAERQRRAAIEAMEAGRWEEFRADLRDVVNYCDQAHAAAISSNKRLKRTEIRIRKISTHLKETKFDVGVDDQPVVQAAIDKLEQFRTELLQKMFGGKAHA
jgi:hypothetical protein